MPRKSIVLLWSALSVSLSLYLVLTSSAGHPVSLRINTSHALGNALGAVEDAGLKPLLEVRVTPSSSGNSPFLPPDRFIEDAKGAGASILSSSFSNWESRFDAAFYQKLTDNGMVHVYAYEPRKPQPENAPPPAAFVTVNKIGGKTGPAIEFGVPTTYMHGKGQSDTPSGVTAQLAGLMACLKYGHPDWNWFDVKAALRSTAGNFGSGYNERAYGYGTVDYRAANALHDAGKLPLFAPAAVLYRQKGDQLPFSINAFQQTRRQGDSLFKFSSPPPLQMHELDLPGILSLGGELLFSRDKSKVGNFLAYRVLRKETAYFVWFTRDAYGRYSRIEPYSILGPVQLKPPESPGPWLHPAGGGAKNG